jgi:phospholipid/cholesterol/gamma-HCH transport system ATP-binding protein
MSILSMTNICKSFGEKAILTNLNLSVHEGETFVILGPSGCGKSVTLRILTGLMEADSGSLTIDGKNMAELTSDQKSLVFRSMGMLFQNAALFDSMTVYENVAYGLRQIGSFKEPEIKDLVLKNLSMVGLNGIENLMPSELSGGMKKRVGLARAIVTKPRFIFYDEPTTGLDPIRATEIDLLIRKLQKELKATAIVITHDLKSAQRVADRVGLHYGGQIQTVANTNDFFKSNDPAIRQFLDGNPNGPITA